LAALYNTLHEHSLHRLSQLHSQPCGGQGTACLFKPAYPFDPAVLSEGFLEEVTGQVQEFTDEHGLSPRKLK
jgi:hypothetical protein